MPHCYPLSFLQAKAQGNPAGREAQLLARGTIEGNTLLIDDAVRKEIMQQCIFTPLRRFNIEQLKVSASRRPAGYVDFILAQGTVSGDMVVLGEAALKELDAKFPQTAPKPPPPPPTLAELAGNFTGAVATWAGAGFKVVEREIYERRHAICLACEHWRPDAMLGIGKCKKCGCSKVKLWLVTSRCPDKPPRW